MLKVLLGLSLIPILVVGYLILSRPSPDESPSPASISPISTDSQNPAINISPSAQYLELTPAWLTETLPDKRRVLFFHASWCPTCKAANLEFMANISQLPADIVVLKADYDTEKSLKTKYGVTYQHTFVQIDAQGAEVAKWNGGGIDELLSNIN